jgi:hypothetical protein
MEEYEALKVEIALLKAEIKTQDGEKLPKQ